MVEGKLYHTKESQIYCSILKENLLFNSKEKSLSAQWLPFLKLYETLKSIFYKRIYAYSFFLW